MFVIDLSSGLVCMSLSFGIKTPAFPVWYNGSECLDLNLKDQLRWLLGDLGPANISQANQERYCGKILLNGKSPTCWWGGVADNGVGEFWGHRTLDCWYKLSHTFCCPLSFSPIWSTWDISCVGPYSEGKAVHDMITWCMNDNRRMVEEVFDSEKIVLLPLGEWN